MKTLLKSTAIAAFLGFVLSGCGPTLKPFSAKSSNSAQDLQSEYDIASLTVQAAKAGNPISIGDVSSLTDDQVIDKLIEFLEGILDRMKDHIQQAKDDGRKLPEDIDKLIENLEKHTQELIARLQSDQDFRAAAVARIRQAQTQHPADSENPARVPDSELTDEMCKAAAKQLASGKLPEFLQKSLQAHYDRDCK